MRFIKYLVVVLILNVWTLADMPFDILPFDQHNVRVSHLVKFQEALKTSFVKTGKYAVGLTPEVSQKLHAKYISEDNIKNQTWDQNKELLDLCKKAGLQRLISGRITFNGKTYSILLRIFDLKEDRIVFSETLFHYTTFENLVNYELDEMVERVVNPAEPITSGLIFNLAGQTMMMENKTVLSPGLAFGYKTTKNVHLLLDFGFPSKDSPWYIGAAIRKIQAKYIIYGLEITYVSEKSDNFDYLSLYNAPKIDQVLEITHSPGLYMGASFRFPLMSNVSLTSEIGMDAFYCEWLTLGSKKESAVLYQFRPKVSLYYYLPMNTKTQFSY